MCKIDHNENQQQAMAIFATKINRMILLKKGTFTFLGSRNILFKRYDSYKHINVTNNCIQ